MGGVSRGRMIWTGSRSPRQCRGCSTISKAWEVSIARILIAPTFTCGLERWNCAFWAKAADAGSARRGDRGKREWEGLEAREHGSPALLGPHGIDQPRT
jgi:hypothetical protein